MGRFVRITQPFMYYALYVMVGAIFVAEAILNLFSDLPGEIHMGY
jgi:hypothetical protein